MINSTYLKSAAGVAGSIVGIIVMWQLLTTYVDDSIAKAIDTHTELERAYIDAQDREAVLAAIDTMTEEQLAIVKDVQINSRNITVTSEQSYQSVTRLLRARRHALVELKRKLDDEVRPELGEERAWVTNEIHAIEDILEQVDTRWPRLQ